MSNELVKAGQAYVATSDKSEVSTGLMKYGGVGLLAGGVAWLIPFVTLPMLLVAMVVAGLVIKAGK